MIEFVRTGPLATLQDLGRPGYAALGVPLAGAFDRGAAALANRLVGNEPSAAVVELTLGGAVLHVREAATIALTGARCPGLDWGTPVSVRAGSIVVLGIPTAGLRSYLAVRGGFDSPAVLGSRSTDTLSGLGPAPLADGDALGIAGPAPGEVDGSAAVPSPALDERPLRVLPGPRDDWFAPAALERLTTTVWSVRSDSDRVGVRLDGPPLQRARSGELPSEPTLPGALQVPPDGRPILFGPDAPVTGGYPVIATVLDADLGRAAQVRPGDAVRFTLPRIR